MHGEITSETERSIETIERQSEGAAWRARYTYATDEEAFKAYKLVTELEDISPSLEPAHAFAEVIKMAPKLNDDHVCIINSCGDSLKDKDIIKKRLGSYSR